MVELHTKHSTEEIAESLYNSYTRAVHVSQAPNDPALSFPPFSHLSLDEQHVYFALAREGPGVLSQLEHQPLIEVARQLYRYAKSPKIGAIILVTTRLSHTKFDDSILGKPLYVAYIGGSI